jgi:RNA recognition motif-containing protein
MNLYVGNISHSATEDTLRELFEKIGPVVSVKIITDKFTGSPRGFGFVQMKTTEDAQKAIEELNGYELDGRALTVNEAREKEERRPSGGFNRGGGSRGGFGGNRGGGSRDRY